MVYATIKNGCLYSAVSGLWQYDYGQVLRIQGMNLPAAVEVHFSLQETGGEAVTRVGVTKNGVTDVVIPDSMLENNGTAADYKIYAFVYLTADASGETVRKIIMPVKSRPKPEAFHTPEEADLFREAVAAVNAAADRAEKAAEFVTGEGATAAKEEIDRYVTEKEEALKGADGETPYIGENGNWYVGETDTGKPAGAKANWDENDPSAPDYIKNRTHWKEPGVVTVIPEQELVYMGSDSDFLHLYRCETEETPTDVGETYIVTFDGVQYERTLVNFDGEILIGNMSIGSDEFQDSGEPFMIAFGPSYSMVCTKETGTHTISCTTNRFIYHKLSMKYLEKGDIIDGFFWHKSDKMTLEEAETYGDIFVNSYAGTGFILKWDDYMITGMQVDNSVLSFWCGRTDMRYNIRLDENGEFDITNINIESFSIGNIGPVGKGAKYRFSVTENRPVTVSPRFVSSGSATENTAFKIEADGSKNGLGFEVLGNGTVKAYSMILPSTAPDSKKKFRITVDDTGALSATEITS